MQSSIQLRLSIRQPAHQRGGNPAPERFSGLRVLDEPGLGGMGREVDDRLNRKITIKVLAARYWPVKALTESLHARSAGHGNAQPSSHCQDLCLGAPDEPPQFVTEYIQRSR